MKYGRLATRLLLGLMFFVNGIWKLNAPQGITDMVSGLGFPAAATLAWIVILVEVIGGAMLIFGYHADLASLPLMIVLLVATVMVHLGIPAPLGEVGAAFRGGTVWLHLVGIAALYDIADRGAGDLAITA